LVAAFAISSPMLSRNAFEGKFITWSRNASE
jgi:hypothetical protein